jgi:RNA polymerase primary sigma factor
VTTKLCPAFLLNRTPSRSLCDQARTIRVPVHMTEAISKVTRTKRQMFNEIGREPTPEQLGKKLRIPIERVRTNGLSR